MLMMLWLLWCHGRCSMCVTVFRVVFLTVVFLRRASDHRPVVCFVLAPDLFVFPRRQQEYSKQIGKLDEGWAKSLNHACQLCQGQTCALCGDKCLKLEPPVIICHHCNKRVVRGGECDIRAAQGLLVFWLGP